jgi:hypothetical protein
MTRWTPYLDNTINIYNNNYVIYVYAHTLVDRLLEDDEC